jgi:hypothetical protein
MNDKSLENLQMFVDFAAANMTSEQKKFVCEYDGCLRSYTTAGNLKTHIKIHRGEQQSLLLNVFMTRNLFFFGHFDIFKQVFFLN